MNTKVESTESSALDMVKLVLAALVFIGGIAAYYLLTDVEQAFRVVGVVVAIAIALAIAAFTAKGRDFREYLHESHFELRKVIWPTQQETRQTTLVIGVVVAIISMILWLIDMALGKIILDWLMKP